MSHIPPREYFGAPNGGGESLHSLDANVFGDELVSEASLARILEESTSARFNGLAEFIVCGFELCLLNQAIFTHFRPAHLRWLNFTEHSSLWPWTKHPLVIGDHRPDSILRFAQEPSGFIDAVHVRLTPDLLRDYTKYFFEEYLARFMAAHQELSILRSEFTQAIAKDNDCVTSLRTNGRWKTTAIKTLLPKDSGEPRRECRWEPATPEEKKEIKASVRFASTGLLLKPFNMKGRLDPRRNPDSYEGKKELALYLAKDERPLKLSQPHWQKVIALAAKRDDHDFFRRLGRLVTSRPSIPDQSQSEAKIQPFLMSHWAVCADGLPELFYLSSPDLVRVCHRRLGTPNTSNGSCGWMEKICVRLGLKSLPRRKKAEARLTAEKDNHGNWLGRFWRPDGWLYP